MHTYKILKDNTVEIFEEGQEAPFLRQPSYPNQDTFDTKKEAETWAKLYIASIEDKAAPYAPIGKGMEGRPKPTKEEKLAMLKDRLKQTSKQYLDPIQQEIEELEAELSS